MIDRADQLAIIRKIAFVQCKEAVTPFPCVHCFDSVSKRIDASAIIDIDLIHTTAVIISNNSGDYEVKDITPLELSFALGVLEDLIPAILEKAKKWI